MYLSGTTKYNSSIFKDQDEISPRKNAFTFSQGIYDMTYFILSLLTIILVSRDAFIYIL